MSRRLIHLTYVRYRQAFVIMLVKGQRYIRRIPESFRLAKLKPTIQVNVLRRLQFLLVSFTQLSFTSQLFMSTKKRFSHTVEQSATQQEYTRPPRTRLIIIKKLWPNARLSLATPESKPVQLLRLRLTLHNTWIRASLTVASRQIGNTVTSSTRPRLELPSSPMEGQITVSCPFVCDTFWKQMSTSLSLADVLPFDTTKIGVLPFSDTMSVTALTFKRKSTTCRRRKISCTIELSVRLRRRTTPLQEKPITFT